MMLAVLGRFRCVKQIFHLLRELRTLRVEVREDELSDTASVRHPESRLRTLGTSLR